MGDKLPSALGRQSVSGGRRPGIEQANPGVRAALEQLVAGAAELGQRRFTAEPRFVRVVPSPEAGAEISVRVGTAEIQVWRGFDPDLLRAVAKALGSGAA